MDNAYTFKRLTKNDVNKLLPLYASAFGFKANADSVNNKFFNDYQEINASYYAEKDVVSSFYGVILQKATYNGSVFTIGQSCDSMTHKDHGGKGLFVKLAGQVYDYLKTKEVDYVFGFPNTTIYNLRIKKLLWQHTENISVFKLKIKTLPFAKLVKKLPAFKGLYNSFLNVVIKKHKSTQAHFPNSLVKSNVAGILHDAFYFNYKKTTDKFILKINDIHLWIKVDGFLWVGDFEITGKENFGSVLNKLKRLAKVIGCTSIVFHFQEGTENSKLLEHFLKVDSEMPVGYIHLTNKHEGVKFKFSGSDFDSW